MTSKVLGLGLLALGLFHNTAFADPPAAPAPQRQIIRWPGGWMYLDEPGVIYHDGKAAKTGSITVITNSGNGIGNKIVVDNGKSSGTTVLSNVRNGIGNSVTVTPKGPVFEVKPEMAPGAPAKKQ